jgi:hypothetical protein
VSSKHRHEREHRPRFRISIPSIAVGLFLTIIAATLFAFNRATGSSTGNAPVATSSGQSSTNATASGSILSTGVSPASTGSHSFSHPSSPTVTPRTSPSVSSEPGSPGPTSTPGPSSTPTSVPSDDPQGNLSIYLSVVQVITPSYVSVSLTPTVILDGHTVMQDCHITWSLYRENALIYYSDANLCGGTLKFRKLPMGKYVLIGQVTLTSGQQVLKSVDIPAACDTIGDCATSSSIYNDPPTPSGVGSQDSSIVQYQI